MGPGWRKKEELLSCVAYRSLSLPRTSCAIADYWKWGWFNYCSRKGSSSSSTTTVVASRASIHTPLESKGELLQSHAWHPSCKTVTECPHLIGIPFRLLRLSLGSFETSFSGDSLSGFSKPWCILLPLCYQWSAQVEVSSSKRFGRGPSSGALEAWQIKFQTHRIRSARKIWFQHSHSSTNSCIPALHSFILNCYCVQEFDMPCLVPNWNSQPPSCTRSAFNRDQQRHYPEIQSKIASYCHILRALSGIYC